MGVLTGSPGIGKTRHGIPPDGAACKGGRIRWGAWATQAAPRSSRQSERLAVLPIVTHTPTPSHVAFSRAPMDDSCHEIGSHRGPPYIDIYTGERLGMGSTAIGREARRVLA